MKPSTIAAIVVGLFLFVSLLLGFYLVSRHRTPPRRRTYADEQNLQTYERWKQNITGNQNTPREQRHHHRQQSSEHALPLHSHHSPSILSDGTAVEGDEHSLSAHTTLPSTPPAAYAYPPYGQADDILSAEHRQVIV